MKLEFPKFSRKALKKTLIGAGIGISLLSYPGYQVYVHESNAYAFSGIMQKPNGMEVPCEYTENKLHFSPGRLKDLDIWNSFGYSNIMTIKYDNMKIIYIDFIDKKNIKENDYAKASIDEIIMRDPNGKEKIIFSKDAGFDRDVGMAFQVANEEYSFIRLNKKKEEFDRLMPQSAKYFVKL